ncbi:hypothetical protein Pmani_011018 [Petrolisthes manimaculis]|uniref:Uncharacterized protein n=1 Tax=Petrolisthes manimaculis TaxID=1843537 RepID=A0AAE1Q3T4_9EUCA|nr:hypothetical protein Pmani_011018 [Petrolisthes manimaculis]
MHITPLSTSPCPSTPSLTPYHPLTLYSLTLHHPLPLHPLPSIPTKHCLSTSPPFPTLSPPAPALQPPPKPTSQPLPLHLTSLPHPLLTSPSPSTPSKTYLPTPASPPHIPPFPILTIADPVVRYIYMPDKEEGHTVDLN